MKTVPLEGIEEGSRMSSISSLVPSGPPETRTGCMRRDRPSVPTRARDIPESSLFEARGIGAVRVIALGGHE
jgi:hypothetical protein